jgi:hypothetical protein
VRETTHEYNGQGSDAILLTANCWLLFSRPLDADIDFPPAYRRLR